MPSRISRRELKVLDWIYEHLRCRVFDRVMPFLSLTGNFGIIWFAAAGTFYFANINQEAAICILLALGCSLLFVNLILKRVTKRPRPYEVRGELRDIIIREPPLLSEVRHRRSGLCIRNRILASLPLRPLHFRRTDKRDLRRSNGHPCQLPLYTRDHRFLIPDSALPKAPFPISGNGAFLFYFRWIVRYHFFASFCIFFLQSLQ